MLRSRRSRAASRSDAVRPARGAAPTNDISQRERRKPADDVTSPQVELAAVLDVPTTRQAPFLAEVAVPRGQEPSQMLGQEVASSPCWQTHVCDQLVDVMRQVRPEHVALRSSRQDISEPGPDAADLRLHLIDGRERQFAAEAL